MKELGAVPVRGDLQTLDVLRSESAQADIVIHLADAWVGNLGEDYSVVVRIDNAAVDAMGEGLKGSGKSLLVTSGTGVVADANGAETTESSPLWEKPLNDRIACEQHALTLCKKGIRVIAIRLPPFVYGRGASGVELFMQRAAAAGEMVSVDQGTKCTSVVHVDDAARMYLLAIEKAKAGDIFNATSSTEVTHRQLTEAMGAALSLPIRSRTYEEQVAANGGSPLAEFLAKFLSVENRASSAKAIKELGWQPKEREVLEDISSGSYQQVARELTKGAA